VKNYRIPIKKTTTNLKGILAIPDKSIALLPKGLKLLVRRQSGEQ